MFKAQRQYGMAQQLTSNPGADLDFLVDGDAIGERMRAYLRAHPLLAGVS